MSVNPATFIWVIYPLVDLRPMLEPKRQLVQHPWQETSIENFLRGFGRVCYRKHDIGEGAAFAWLRANEAWYISGRHFARVMPKERGAQAEVADGWRVRQAIPPRLFTDGVLSARLEIVLEASSPGGDPHEASLLRGVAQLAVELRRNQAGSRATWQAYGAFTRSRSNHGRPRGHGSAGG